MDSIELAVRRSITKIVRDFDESQHPRDEKGMFSSGGGTSRLNVALRGQPEEYARLVSAAAGIIPEEHLTGLNAIRLEPPPGFELSRGGHDYRDTTDGSQAAAGYVTSTQTIHIPERTASSILLSTVLTHEMGHHYDSMTKMGYVDNPTAKKFGWAVKGLRDKAAGLQSRELARIGLRRYSLTNRDEMFADMYATWHEGSDAARGSLQSWVQSNTKSRFDLREVFGERRPR